VDYNSALELKPNDAGSYFARGTARQAKEDLNGALADYSKTIELDPNLATAYANRAVIETLQGKWAAADADFDKAFKIDPSLKSTFKAFIESRKRKSAPLMREWCCSLAERYETLRCA